MLSAQRLLFEGYYSNFCAEVECSGRAVSVCVFLFFFSLSLQDKSPSVSNSSNSSSSSSSKLTSACALCGTTAVHTQQQQQLQLSCLFSLHLFSSDACSKLSGLLSVHCSSNAVLCMSSCMKKACYLIDRALPAPAAHACKFTSMVINQPFQLCRALV
jgi:hypothetical protein